MTVFSTNRRAPEWSNEINVNQEGTGQNGNEDFSDDYSSLNDLSDLEGDDEFDIDWYTFHPVLMPFLSAPAGIAVGDDGFY